MELTSKKIINTVITGVGIIAFAYGYYLHQRSLTNQRYNLFAKEVTAHNTHVNNQGGRQLSGGSQQIEKSKDNIVGQSRAKIGLSEYQEMIRWSDERGYISSEDYQIYQSYSEQTLKNLSDSGDIKAMNQTHNFSKLLCMVLPLLSHI